MCSAEAIKPCILQQYSCAIVKHFQGLVQNGANGWKLEPYEHISQQGYWRQLTVRSSRNGNLMVLVVLHPQSLNEEEKNLIKINLINYFDKSKNLSKVQNGE